ncbi:MAG: 23S rRNA (adenine(2503)-C(2))-methyltransferase RlmN, partial [Finegoldia magna]|nr:23S rRNA (adenine(2503)-C(2))-methyltransferase RlmN [Finegoldia magna]
FMQYKTHTSICLSTQIGCKMGCKFCASTKKSFVRNLQPYEMCAQIYLVENDLDIRINNIVLMGIGEPLDNYDNVSRFIDLITDKDGQDMSIRNITLSTCGLVDKIIRLANDDIGINITISLHNPFDNERNKLMPIGNKYSIEEILDACDYYFKKTKRRIGFEYTVIENVNDSKKYMDKLVSLLKNRNCLLNLITLNPIEEFNQKSPDRFKMTEFMEYMNKNNVNTTIRRKQGIDIDGACGQLRINNMTKRGVK